LNICLLISNLFFKLRDYVLYYEEDTKILGLRGWIEIFYIELVDIVKASWLLSFILRIFDILGDDNPEEDIDLKAISNELVDGILEFSFIVFCLSYYFLAKLYYYWCKLLVKVYSFGNIKSWIFIYISYFIIKVLLFFLYYSFVFVLFFCFFVFYWCIVFIRVILYGFYMKVKYFV
jgi:hypothetical protein